jgi:hypothetical protein
VPAEITFLTSMLVRNLKINTGFTNNEITVPFVFPKKAVLAACNGNLESNPN